MARLNSSPSLTGRVVIALICGVAGAVLLVGLPSSEVAHNQVLSGTLFSLFAAVCYASVFLGGRFLAARYHPLQVTGIEFVAGVLVLVPINLASGIVIAHTAQSWLLVLYLGLVPTALAYWLFQKGLRTVSAMAASILNMLDPLVAALLAWGLFGETLAAAGIGGAGLLILSMFVLSVDRRR